LEAILGGVPRRIYSALLPQPVCCCHCWCHPLVAGGLELPSASACLCRWCCEWRRRLLLQNGNMAVDNVGSTAELASEPQTTPALGRPQVLWCWRLRSPWQEEGACACRKSGWHQREDRQAHLSSAEASDNEFCVPKHCDTRCPQAVTPTGHMKWIVNRI